MVPSGGVGLSVTGMLKKINDTVICLIKVMFCTQNIFLTFDNVQRNA